jgi:ferritin-like metal-binding protein YciE
MAKTKSRSRPAKESPDAQELLLKELREIHSAESQLVRVLPRLMRSVDSDALRELIETRTGQGERIIEELDSAFEEMQESPGRKKNVAAEGLINDVREHVQEIERGPALDAVLIAAMQKTEHYCIAAWGTARSMAQSVEQKTVATIMERALKEGGELDNQLTRLAEEEVTPALLANRSEDDDEESEDEENNEKGRTRSRERA